MHENLEPRTPSSLPSPRRLYGCRGPCRKKESAMLDKFFKLSEHNTTVRTELLAGLTTFLTMAYIIFVQPAVLSGSMFGKSTGMDFASVTVASWPSCP